MFRQLMNAKYDAEIFFFLQDLDYHSDYLLLWSKKDTSKSDYQTLPRQGRTDFFLLLKMVCQIDTLDHNRSWLPQCCK